MQTTVSGKLSFKINNLISTLIGQNGLWIIFN